ASPGLSDLSVTIGTILWSLTLGLLALESAIMGTSSESISADALAATICADAGHELSEAFKKLQHCVNQLSSEQVWWREQESQNMVVNLILHLTGNLRQWIVAGLGGAADTRDRPREFAERAPMDKSELLRQLSQVVQSAIDVLRTMT